METEIVWMDDDSPSLSMCAECRHRIYRTPGANCAAYPNGIPDRWLFTTDVHTQVEPDQRGTAVFESINEPVTA